MKTPMTVFTRARWAVIIAVVLTLGSMIRYPGGTSLDAAAQGYSPSRNFLSDLGMTVAYNQQPNKLGAGLFVLSLITLVVGLGGCLAGLVRLYSTSARARRLARGAAAVGFLVCAAFVGVAVTPENRVMGMHVEATLFAFRTFPVLSLLFLLASVFSETFPRRVAISWGALTIVLTVYVGVLGWGPSLATLSGLAFQVTAQKIVASAALVVFLIVTAEADRVLSTLAARPQHPWNGASNAS
jgi:hypothetical protein